MQINQIWYYTVYILFYFIFSFIIFLLLDAIDLFSLQESLKCNWLLIW